MLSHALAQAEDILDLMLSTATRNDGIEVDENQTIYIYSSKLKESDEDVILHIFKHFYLYPDTTFKVCIYTSKATHNNFKDECVIYTPACMQGVNPSILHNLAEVSLLYASPYLLNAMIDALKKTQRSFNFDLFAKQLKVLLADQDDSNVEVLFSLMIIFKVIQKRCADPSIIKQLLTLLLKVSVSTGSIVTLKALQIDLEMLKEVINESDAPERSYLHTLLAKTSIYPTSSKDDDFDLLLQCKSHDEIITHNSKGESLLELCNHKQYYDVFLSIMKKKSRDLSSDLKAAMVAACKLGNTDKIIFLLRADMTVFETFQQEIKKNTSISSDFNTFCNFHVHGKTLEFFPELLRQRGYTCGFYAARSSYSFLRMLYPHQFCGEIIHARSADVAPKASKSLLKMAKAKGNLTCIGELFSSEAMGEVIKLTGCQSSVFDIKTKDDFIKVIRAAIDHNYPVILPFSSNAGKANSNAKGEFAHWAVIIGYTEDSLLTVQYHSFITDTIENYYFAFDQIENEYPRRLFRKENKEWTKVGEATESTDENGLIISADLSQFRRRLVVVLPPHHHAEEWKQSVLGQSWSPSRVNPFQD